MIQLLFHKLWEIQCFSRDFYVFLGDAYFHHYWWVEFLFPLIWFNEHFITQLMLVHFCSESEIQSSWISSKNLLHTEIICVRHWRFGNCIIARQTIHALYYALMLLKCLGHSKFRFQLPIMLLHPSSPHNCWFPICDRWLSHWYLPILNLNKLLWYFLSDSSLS